MKKEIKSILFPASFLVIVAIGLFTVQNYYLSATGREIYVDVNFVEEVVELPVEKEIPVEIETGTGETTLETGTGAITGTGEVVVTSTPTPTVVITEEPKVLGSIDNPYKSISEAIDNSITGDTIIIREGEYVLTEPVIIEELSNLNVKSYDGEVVSISSISNAFNVIDSNSINFSGLNFISSQNAIVFDNSSDSSVIKNIFKNQTNSGVKVLNSINIDIDSNIFVSSSNGVEIQNSSNLGSSEVLVKNNVFKSNNGVNINGSTAFSYVSILNNNFVDYTGNALKIVEAISIDGNEFINNIVEGTNAVNIANDSLSTFRFENNLWTDGFQRGIRHINSYVVNPKFTDSSKVTLDTTSPVANLGKSMNTVSTDYFGNRRGSTNTSIGVHEVSYTLAEAEDIFVDDGFDYTEDTTNTQDKVVAESSTSSNWVYSTSGIKGGDGDYSKDDVIGDGSQDGNNDGSDNDNDGSDSDGENIDGDNTDGNEDAARTIGDILQSSSLLQLCTLAFCIFVFPLLFLLFLIWLFNRRDTERYGGDYIQG